MHTGNVITQPDQTNPDRSGRRQWLLAGLLLLVVVLSSVTTVDRFAEQKYEALFQRAFVTFALARTLNGLISAVQGTELALQPAGVGVTLTPGEILDPVNDLVERFSWIMLGATISLGIQQVLLDVGQWWGVRLLVALLGLAWLVLRIQRQRGSGQGRAGLERSLLHALVIVLFIRFAVPMAMIANEALYHLFLESRYVESAEIIEAAGEQMESVAEQVDEGSAAAGTEPGLFESLGRSLSGAGEALDFSERLERMQARAAEVIEHLIQLSVVFVLQTGILPIAFLWVFLQLFKQMFRLKY
ncbi:MAG: hypothetical protein OQK01_09595 [Xanthomonadales bacterium]|jgi:hypothetical protein|nr:hypothetical protein [Xanthomonadales bacterium]